MNETLILRPQFMDRGGRMVYLAFPITEQLDEETGQMALQQGPPLAQVRIDPNDTTSIEFLSQPVREPAPEQGFVPGVEGDGTG
jgi:hypothetical protein